MLIRALTRACGRLTFEPDQILDVDEADGVELLAAGAAVRVKPLAEVEQIADPVETDSQKPSKSKKG